MHELGNGALEIVGENKRNKIVALTISGTLPQSRPLVGGVGEVPPPVMKYGLYNSKQITGGTFRFARCTGLSLCHFGSSCATCLTISFFPPTTLSSGAPSPPPNETNIKRTVVRRAYRGRFVHSLSSIAWVTTKCQSTTFCQSPKS